MLDVKWCWGNVFVAIVILNEGNVVLSVSACHPELVSGSVVSR